MCSATGALSPLKVPVIGCGNTLAGSDNVAIQRATHGATRLPPFHSRIDEHAIEAFHLRLFFNEARARHN